VRKKRLSIFARLFTVVRLALLAVFIAILPAPWVSCVRGNASPLEAVYGAKVKFHEKRTLRFPDFELTYLGRRHVTPPQYPRGWWVHDFKANAGGAEQIVSWSAGTGSIGPSQFNVSGSLFQLELVHSDKLGKLAEGELVVSPAKEESTGVRQQRSSVAGPFENGDRFARGTIALVVSNAATNSHFRQKTRPSRMKK